MRVRVILQAEGSIWVPWHYPEWLQGLIYKKLKKSAPDLASRLHSEGFVAGSKRYKLITFSWLFPKSAVQKENGLLMTPPIKWWISSPLAAVIEAIVYCFLTWPEIQLGKQKLLVAVVQTEPIFCPGDTVILETLSPIVVSTGVIEGGKLRKIFLSPESQDFSRVITENLQHKALALWGEKISEGTVEMKPLEYHSKLVTVYGTKVRCYEGVFEVKGHPELIKLGYEAGFGERNFQGFGMMRFKAREVVHEAQNPAYRR